MKTTLSEQRIKARSTRRWLWLAFGGCTLSALGGAAKLSGRSASDLPGAASQLHRTAETERVPAVNRARRAAASADDGNRWVVGERRAFAVHCSLHLESEPPDLIEGVDLAGEGTLALTVVTDDLDSVVLRGELIDFTGTYSSSAGNVPAPEEALRQPFLLTLSRRGGVEHVALHPDLVGIWHALVRTVIATTEFVEPELAEDAARGWLAEESDQLGRYRASYTPLERGVFTKTKGKYSHFELAAELQRSGSGPKMTSKTQYSVDSLWRVERAEAVETTTVQLGASALVSTTRVSLEFMSSRTAERPAEDPWMAAQRPLYENRAALPLPETERERKLGLVAGADFETLARELRSSTPGTDERWAAMDRLSALFDLDPDSIAEVRRLLAGRLPPEDARGLMGALAGATTPEAQRALTEVAKNSVLDVEVRDTALIHLGVATAPTEATLAELAGLASNSENAQLRDQARFALGGAAGRALKHAGTEEAAARAVDSLRQGLEHATDEPSRQLYVTALGNTGAADALELLEEQLGDSNPATRSAAAQALRSISAARVDQILAELMLHDPALQVRQAAISAAGHRDLGAPVATAASKILLSEPEQELRFEVLRALGEKLLRAGWREVVERIAANDASSAVKATANELLRQGSE